MKFTEFVVFSVSHNRITQYYRKTQGAANKAFNLACCRARQKGINADICIVGYSGDDSQIVKQTTIKSKR